MPDETEEKPKKNRFVFDDEDVDAMEIIRKEDREDLDQDE